MAKDKSDDEAIPVENVKLFIGKGQGDELFFLATDQKLLDHIPARFLQPRAEVYLPGHINLRRVPWKGSHSPSKDVSFRKTVQLAGKQFFLALIIRGYTGINHHQIKRVVKEARAIHIGSSPHPERYRLNSSSMLPDWGSLNRVPSTAESRRS